MRNHNLPEVVETAAQERRRRSPKFDWLCKLFIILFCKRPKRDVPCLYIPERVINRPDPCIYSQFLNGINGTKSMMSKVLRSWNAASARRLMAAA